MPRGNNKRRRNKNTSIVSVKEQNVFYFYPLFSGWITEHIPIFDNPSEALCWQISKYFKDSLCHSFSILDYPQWIRHLGGFVSTDKSLENSSLRALKIGFKSKAEQVYFHNIKMYSYTGTKAITKVVVCSQELFSTCRNTFNKHPDYQASSGSVFRKGQKCVSQVLDIQVSIPTNLDGVPRSKSPNNLICFGINSMNHFRQTRGVDIGK